jgi:hypothetical protein
VNALLQKVKIINQKIVIFRRNTYAQEFKIPNWNLIILTPQGKNIQDQPKATLTTY